MDTKALIKQIKGCAKAGLVLVSGRAAREMAVDNFRLAEVTTALREAVVMGEFQSHRRGQTWNLYGLTKSQRPVHVVLAFSDDHLVLHSVFAPLPPKWATRRST